MIVTVEYLRRQFALFNDLIFGGRLPECELRVVSARTFRGNCRSRVVTTESGRRVHRDFVIQISTAFDLSCDEIDDTIIHEMIHYFIGWNGLPDSTAHGPIFRAMMSEINRAHGRHLRISYRGENSASPRKARTVVVCVITFRNGTSAIKVLPRRLPTIEKFRRALLRNGDVREMEFYLSSHQYFDRYPASGALRCYMFDKEQLDAALKESERLKEF